MRYLRKVFVALLLMVGGTAFAQNTFTVDAPRVVGQDEIFRVVFTADGEIKDFVNPTVTGAEILAGPSPSRMQSTQIINGKRTESLEISYTFIMRPTGEGTARISPASATIGNKVYTTREVSIEVVKGDSQQGGTQTQQGEPTGNAQQRQTQGEVSSKDVFLKLSFSKTKVVKGEPIVATLKLYTRVPIAGFEDIRFPVFNGFWSQEIETPQNINFVRENVDGQIYNSAVLRRYMLLPQQTGDVAVKPAEMICQVQIRNTQSGGRSIFDDFFDSGYHIVKKRISSAESVIKVSPLPAGAPASFGQGVGNFSIDVKLSRDSVKAHEAGSVIVTVQGSGNLNLIEAPKVELPADFELYDMKTSNNYSYGSNGISGSKTFEYPFIPRSEGVFEIPPVEYSYYDVKSGRYVTLKSLPVTVKVAKGENVAGTGSLIQGVSKQAVASLGEDIRYIVQGSPALAMKGKFFIGSVWYFVVLALLAAGYGAIYWLLAKRAKMRGDVVRTRNRKANKVARKRLKLAQEYLSQNLRSPFYEEMHKALLGYVSDKLAMQFADMQRETIRETMEAKGVSAANISDFMQLLEDCEMARYSMDGGAGEMSAQYQKAIAVISNLEGEL